MKLSLMIGLMTLMSLPAFAINCNEMSYESSVLCKQNKRILRKLNSLGSGGSNMMICAVKYCSYNGKVENRAEYIDQCNTTNTYWPVKTIEVEARNRVHAREVFANLNLDSWKPSVGLLPAFRSATCE